MNEAIKFYESGNEMGFHFMLKGAMQFRVERRPGMGHDYNMILNTLYEYYRNINEGKKISFQYFQYDVKKSNA